MKKIKYLFKRIKGMNFSNMFDTAKEVSKETGKNRFLVLFDIIHCGYKYMAGFVDYKVFKMYNLNEEQRATYITRGVNNNYVKLLNDPEAMKKVDNKLEFNKNYNEFVKRDWICLTEVSFEEFETFLKKHKSIIVKPVDEMCGKGVDKITLDENTNIKQIYDDLLKNNQILIEECVKQNSKIASLNPSSVNTLRVVTLKKENEVKIHSIPFKDILLLAIATSIDALAVGVSFAFLKVNLFLAITTIGITTFILSFVCVLFGKKLGSLFEKYAEYLGGIILILLGIKILIEHLFF